MSDLRRLTGDLSPERDGRVTEARRISTVRVEVTASAHIGPDQVKSAALAYVGGLGRCQSMHRHRHFTTG